LALAAFFHTLKLEKTPWLLTLKMDIQASFSLLAQMGTEKTHESRIECLTKIKEVRNKIVLQSFCNCLLSFSCPFSPLLYFPPSLFKQEMEHLENNKFGYAYIIDNDSDLTPPDDQLESMDAYMLDHQLLNFMQQVLEGADQLFYHPEQHDD
jgi:hypothetical protein